MGTGTNTWQGVRTVQGDTLSAVVWRHTGSSRGMEQVLDANPHLADLPAVLPAGIVIALPPQPGVQTSKPASVSLWD